MNAQHATHTPGPWEVKDGRPQFPGYEIRANGRAVGNVLIGTKVKRAEANARLIAAAPELYDALSGMVGFCTLLLANALPPHIRTALESHHRVIEARAILHKVEAKS